MQTVSHQFLQHANGDIRKLSWGSYLSFDKASDPDLIWFTLNQSQLNSNDILGISGDEPLLPWYYYKYGDFTERLIYMNVSRSLEFPYSVVSAIADFQLNNYDKYLTPNSGSPISSYILPKRPVRLLQGFSNVNLPQFVGLTEGMPEIDREGGTATFTAMDFLTWIYDMPIRNTELMINVRTDEVLANIFDQFGLTPAQYDLAKGRNKIPFLFFEKEQQTAGDIIRPLMQAEMGMLWLDEQGIIRFRPRLEQPDNPVYTFDSDSVISLDTEGEDTIINHVIINASPRRLQEPQSVYSVTNAGSDENTINASSSKPINLELEDPSINIVQPTLGEGTSLSWFRAQTTTGVEVTSGITVTGVAELTNSYTIFVQNSNAFPVIITDIFLWGEPAKIIGGKPLVWDGYDDVSTAKYEEKVITIDNNFIQSLAQTNSLGLTMLDEYAEYSSVLNLEVKGNMALQLSDIISLDYEEFTGQYRIIGINNKLQDSKFTQILKLRSYTPRQWFTLNQSQLNGSDNLAP